MSPLQRFEKLPHERQHAILEAAAEEFAAHGFDRASINRIIAATGLSKGAMYYYFDDKEDLFVTVLVAYEAHATGMELDPSALTPETFWPALEAWGHAMAQLTVDHPTFAALGRAFYELPQSRWSTGRIGEYLARMMTRIRAWVTHGQSVGVVRGDLEAGLLVELWMSVNTVLDRYTLESWDAADDAERDRLVDLHIGMMKRMFRPEEAP